MYYFTTKQCVMTKAILPILILPLSLALTSCGVSYPEAESKHAKKACACYNEAAAHAENQMNFYYEHYDKVAVVPGKELDKETDEYKTYAEMTLELRDLKDKALNSCLMAYEKEEEVEGVFQQNRGELPFLSNKICPEIYYLVKRAYAPPIDSE